MTLLSSLRGLVLFSLFLGAAANAAESNARLIIKDHRFVPAELRVPAGQKVRLTIDNQDPTPEEFESHELNREKVIAGHSSGVVFIGPLAPGRYPFIGEFHDKTARGVLIAE